MLVLLQHHDFLIRWVLSGWLSMLAVAYCPLLVLKLQQFEVDEGFKASMLQLLLVRM